MFIAEIESSGLADMSGLRTWNILIRLGCSKDSMLDELGHLLNTLDDTGMQEVTVLLLE